MDPEIESLLLPAAADSVEGASDHRGRPAKRGSSGGWTSAAFIIGVEIAERFAYYGVSTNLIMYLTNQLGESTAQAASNVNVWMGAASMLPLLGGLVADSCLGRYVTIAVASCLYLVGLSMITLSAGLPALRPPPCAAGACSRPTGFQTGFFFASIYLIAFAQGGHKPCVQALGADQFDEKDPVERRAKSSFFNWWYFGMCGGTLVTTSTLTYIQDNVSWVLGFGIPLGSMAIALVVFLAGTPTYRFYNQHARRGGISRSGGIVTVVGEILYLFPVWATCLAYAVVFAQSPTFFTKQGATMDRRVAIGSVAFEVPPAALQSFISLSTVAFIPIYDQVIIRRCRRLTGNPSGITLLQRIGIGQVLSLASMIIGALVEARRLAVAAENATGALPFVPMSLWWLVPQYILTGVSDVFTMVGLQEFFYDQIPGGMRSLGLSLYLSIFGVGSLLSGLLVYLIDNASKSWGGNGKSWFNDDLNSGHLDYFYWLLAVLSAISLLVYVYFARCYTYRKGSAADLAKG